MLERLDAARTPWDVVVIGGGATGVGVALDAASRGYSTVLVERGDFAQGTSSRSTKLIHGGVRYLRQGNVSLVLESLRERAVLRKNAPHLVRDLPFVVPIYDWWEGPFYGAGLKVYDLLAGRHGFGRSHLLSREETCTRIPTIEREGLRGGIVYHDGQFDDARLVIELAKTASREGATVLNYMRAESFLTRAEAIEGIVARDVETGVARELRARVVINATGAFCDDVRRLEDQSVDAMIQPSQGIHLVLDRSFLPRESAIMVPHTDDGRVLFVIPWRERVLVGTTDTALERLDAEPVPFAHEIDFLLEHAGRYLSRAPSRSDVLSAFAGIRPLVKNTERMSTASLARDHVIHVSRGGLVTITGGKWTTYRKMAEDAVDQAAEIGGLPEHPCRTRDLPIGDRRKSAPDPSTTEEAVRKEMARTVEDVLARRTRDLILDAKASAGRAPQVARDLARILGRNEDWEKQQIERYGALSLKYQGAAT
jgi:glycerol-3-phosphate dehydrogenase